jgi:hypothetical protein
VLLAISRGALFRFLARLTTKPTAVLSATSTAASACVLVAAYFARTQSLRAPSRRPPSWCGHGFAVSTPARSVRKMRPNPNYLREGQDLPPPPLPIEPRAQSAHPRSPLPTPRRRTHGGEQGRTVASFSDPANRQNPKPASHQPAGRTSPAAGVNEQNLTSIFDFTPGRYGLGLGF